jgi:hypothetical protein
MAAVESGVASIENTAASASKSRGSESAPLISTQASRLWVEHSRRGKIKAQGTCRFRHVGMGAKSVGGSQRVRSRMRAIADDNHSMRARRHRESLLQINTSFPETARWKRCVPRELSSFQRDAT